RHDADQLAVAAQRLDQVEHAVRLRGPDRLEPRREVEPDRACRGAEAQALESARHFAYLHERVELVGTCRRAQRFVEYDDHAASGCACTPRVRIRLFAEFMMPPIRAT